MTEQQLENTLHSAIEHAAPDRLDAILSRCGAQEQAPASPSGKKRSRRFVPWLIAACLALLYCIDSSFVSSVALSVADFMAIIRALCSLAKASTRHP